MIPILLETERHSDGSGTVDLDLDKVPEGEYWRLDHVSAEDQTTACTSLRVGIVRGGVFYPLEEQITVVAANVYSSVQPVHLGPSQQLRARFVGTTNADKLSLVANGVRIPPSVPPLSASGEGARG